MATEFITNDFSGPYVVDNGDEVVLLGDVTLTSATGGFQNVSPGTFTSADLFLDGDVFARLNVATLQSTVASNLDVTIGASGSANSLQSNAITMTGSILTLANQGSITSAGLGGLLTASTIGEVNNSGTITAGTTGIWLDGATGANTNDILNTGVITGVVGIRVEDASADISNSGNIQGSDNAVYVSRSALSTMAGDITIFNSGQLHGSVAVIGANAPTSNATFELTLGNTGTLTGGALYAPIVFSNNNMDIFRLDNSGTILIDGFAEMTGRRNFLNNSGTIEARVVLDSDTSLGGTASLTNGGYIRDASVSGETAVLTNASSGVINDSVGVVGSTFASTLNEGSINGNLTVRTTDPASATLRNTGEISGRVTMGNNGDDVLRNSGTIGDDVILQSGADLYRAAPIGVTVGTVFGGAGLDTLIGGDASDRLSGEADPDDIQGRGGNDSLLGGDGLDTLRGGDGQDTMEGGAGDDRVLGNLGDDLLIGNGDNDRMVGGAGNDTLDGGLGRDVLFADLGQDVFVYRDVTESQTQSQADRVVNFISGEDKIDLSEVATGLSFIGTSAFSGSAREVRYVITGSGLNVVIVDADGNGSEDMRIVLTNTPSLTEDDFLF